MITVHHLERSRSQRVLWMLEELGVEYELKLYKRDPVTLLAPPELKSVHPLGKSPVVTDGEHVLAESGAILEYLVNTYGAGRFAPPPGSAERQRYTYWMHYAEGSAMPPLLLKLVFEQIKAKSPWPIRPIAKAIANTVLGTFVDPQIKTHYDFVESELGKHPWFVGEEFTAADIQMSFPVEASIARVGAQTRPRMVAWRDKIYARPAHQRAIAKGGPVIVE